MFRRSGHRFADKNMPHSYVDFGLMAIMLTGTSVTPRLAADLAQWAMRSMEAGNAVAVPTAMPRSRAMASRRVSAASMAVGVGSASSTMSALANGALLAPAIWLATLRAEVPSSK